MLRQTSMGSPSRRTYLLDRTDACKDHNILSDRERDSEYLQIPMLTFQQRLVLESVKCREDMKYGAANTALRLTGRAWLIAELCFRQHPAAYGRKLSEISTPHDPNGHNLSLRSRTTHRSPAPCRP